ncbi:MAG: bifunctional phosphoribosylaminoimidazolecarboxamide formyltransferase/IMP cyclohydrolase, partial [Planctomycetota bacterium]
MDHPLRRALLSVSNKQGVAEFAASLHDRGIELISTGGTAAALAEHGLHVTPVEKLTGFPEMLGGRVKTLHPAVHGGILGIRGDAEHERQMAEHGIGPIDLVVIDLYPFEQTIAREGVTTVEAVEQIDIGGPAMIRSAAKNHDAVAVITDTNDYARVLEDLASNNGSLSATLRSALAAKAFARTAAYDATIAGFLSRPGPSSDADNKSLPPTIAVSLAKDRTLRYGENPHQQAAVYREPGVAGGVLAATQLHGKPLSYNNIADASAAWALAMNLDRLRTGTNAAVIVKHANPCGVAISDTVRTAIDGAFAGDPVAAYGGILACSTAIDGPSAERLCQDGVFLEVVVATAIEPAALDRLRDRWPNLRVLLASRGGTP